MGAAALESDVWCTRDGHVVLDHDGWVAGSPSRQRIAAVDRADLPAHVPTLAELYTACGTEFELSLDVKDTDALDRTIAVAEQAGGGALGRLWICDTDEARVLRWAARLPQVRVVASLRIDRLRRSPARTMGRLADGGVAVLNLRGPNWTPRLVQRCHAAGLLAFSWDLQSARAIARAVSWGIDGVYTDHAHLLRGLPSEPAEV